MSTRTKEERVLETRCIVNKLNELKLSIIHEPVYKLFEIMRKYIHEGMTQNIDIPMYMINKKIHGILEIEKDKQCMVKIICL